MNNITVIIHSYPSYPHIDETLKSARLLTDQIILIPSPDFEIVETRRAFGIRKARTQWVLLLDADERVTRSLAQEVKEAIQNTSYGFYQIPRKELLFNSYWLKHGGWWPNYQTRLIQKKMFVDWPKYIHSTPVIKGKKGLLLEPIIHYSQNNFTDIVDRTVIFESNESELLFKAKKNASTLTFFRKFFGELFRRLIQWQGFRDGTIGIIESIYQAFSKTITYIFLYEKNRSIRSIP